MASQKKTKQARAASEPAREDGSKRFWFVLATDRSCLAASVHGLVVTTDEAAMRRCAKAGFGTLVAYDRHDGRAPDYDEAFLFARAYTCRGPNDPRENIDWTAEPARDAVPQLMATVAYHAIGPERFADLSPLQLCDVDTEARTAWLAGEDLNGMIARVRARFPAPKPRTNARAS